MEEGGLTMALFTNKADEDLPLLTQFYQLEFDIDNLEKSELDQWVGSDGPEEYWSESENARRGGMVATRASRLSGSGPNTFYIPRLNRLAHAHPVIREIMACIADGVKPSRKTIFDFNQILATVPQLQVEWADVFGKPTICKENRAKPRPVLVYQKLVSEMIVAIEPILEDHKAPTPFARCEECESPYLIVKKGQVYCSQRCRARAGERRRYAVRMEGYPTKNKRKS
jgi:hypothetical protein